MKLLLDTHIWLWHFLGNPKLSPTLRTTITAPDTEIWLSPISIWETVMLAERSRISLQPSPDEWIDQALTLIPTQEATLNYTIARLSRQLPIPHQDPADGLRPTGGHRFIAATAVYYNLTLATVDHNLIGIPGLPTLS